MYASSEKKIDILNDHYKDTFSHLVGYRKQRDRMLLFLTVVLTIMFLYQLYPEKTTSAISDAVTKKIGIGKLDSLLVYVLLSIISWLLSFRYFQLRELIDEQYQYLQKLEEDLSSLFPSGVPFTRESNFSVQENRNLSLWSHYPYNRFFHILFTFWTALSATFTLRHYGYSQIWLITFIAWIIHYLYLAGFKTILKNIWRKIRSR